MIKQIRIVSLLAVAAAAMTFTPVHIFAADTNAPVVEKPKAPKPPKTTLPFHGTVGAIDKSALTVTVGERTFQVTSDTKINRDGKPAILDDAVVGDTVGGAYKKTTDGKLDAVTLNFMTKGDKPTKPAKPQTPEKPAGDM